MKQHEKDKANDTENKNLTQQGQEKEKDGNLELE